MALLGVPLLVLLGTLTVLLPAATVLFWRRHPGGLLAGARRLAMVLLSQLAAILLVAAGANDYGYFYGSWRDLLQQVNPTSSTGGSASIPLIDRVATTTSPSTLAATPALARSTVEHLRMTPWSGRSQWATRGRLESVTLEGSRSALSSHAFVYLPPQYFQPAYRNVRFPATEVLTGYPGNDLNLIDRMDYQGRLLTEMQSGRAKPMVLVMMRPSVVYPRDAECTDVPSGPLAETFFAEDVPSAVSTTYRVRTTGWGSIGDSTGGYCSVKIVMDNSYVFSAGVGLSAYYHTLEDSTTGDLWGGSAAVRNLNDLEWQLGHRPAPPVSLLLTSSKHELGPEGLPDLQKFLSLVRRPLSVSTIIESHGGHNLATWDRELGPALDWLSTRVTAA